MPASEKIKQHLRFSSGTYYVEASEENRYYRWACYLCLFLLLVVSFAVILAAILYNSGEEDIKEIKSNTSFVNDFHAHCDVKGNWTDDQITTFEKYFNSYKGKNISDACTGIQCYLSNQKTIETYNSQTGKGIRHFGNTIFSDWCEDKRRSYVHPLRTSRDAKVQVNDSKAHRFSRNYSIAEMIVFNDTMPINKTVKSALFQWIYHATTDSRIRSMYKTWEDFYKKVSPNYELFDIIKADKSLRDDDFHKNYLLKEGVFATVVYLHDHVFFYQDDVFPRQVCEAEHNINKMIGFPVLVLGYGHDGNGKTQYWDVLPIGEQFKQWGKKGIIRIPDSCYKKYQNPRIIDIDTKTRSDKEHQVIPHGKHSALAYQKDS